MENKILEMLFSQGGGYIFAGLIFYFYHSSVQGLLRDTKKVIEDNTKAYQKAEISNNNLANSIDKLADKLDRFNGN